MALALRPSATPRPAPGARYPRVSRAVIALLLCLAGAVAAAYCALAERKGAPTIHDEHAYLFQAKALAFGRICGSALPSPEHFEAAHVLVEPCYAAKYPPGHALVLAPFVSAGVPWLAPALLFGLAAAALYLGLLALGASVPAALSPAVVFLASPHVLKYFSSLLSQTTATAVVALACLAAAHARRNPSAGRLAALGAVVGFALLVRTYTGLALLGATVLVLCLARPSVRSLAALALPIGAASLLLLGYNHRVTGSAWRMPWSEYARQYTPFDGPGIGAISTAEPARPLPRHLRPMAEDYRRSRLAYTWERLPKALEQRASRFFDLTPGTWVFVFAAGGFLAAGPALLFAGAFMLAFVVLQLTFHAASDFYFLELYPPLLLAAGLGLASALRRLSRWRPLPRAAGHLALGLIGLWIATAVVPDLRFLPQAWASSAERTRQVEAAIAAIPDARALVFLAYPDTGVSGPDYTYNEPILERARVVRAIDLGERNREICRLWPDRAAYRLDVATLELTPTCARAAR